MYSLAKQRGWHSCALVATATSLLVLPGLGDVGLWDPFELDVVERALQSHGNSPAPATDYLVELGVRAGGLNGFAARLPIGLMAVFTAVLCYAWIARSVSSRVASLASILLISSPLFLLHARLVTSLMPLLAAQLLVFIGVTEMVFARGRVRWLGAGIGLCGLLLNSFATSSILGLVVSLTTMLVACIAHRHWRASSLLGVSVALVIGLAWQGALQWPGPWRALAANASWDLMLEQICFGAFPWVVFAPVALCSATFDKSRASYTKRIAVSWVALSLVASTFHGLHVGPTVFLALPGLALAVSWWLVEHDTQLSFKFHHALLLSLLLVMLGRDLASFSDRLSALGLPVETVANGVAEPFVQRLFLAAAIALSCLLLLGLFRGIRRHVASAVLGACAVFALVFSHVWMPSVSRELSHQHLVERYLALKQNGDEIFSLNRLPRVLQLFVPSASAVSQAQLSRALSEQPRVFALVPQSTFCSLRQQVRRIGGAAYLLNKNTTYSLISNQHEPREARGDQLDEVLSDSPSEDLAPKNAIVFGSTMRLVSVEMPARVRRGDSFSLRMRYQVLKRPLRKWKIFAHFDGPGIRFQGDHWPIGDRCASNEWNPGDLVTDVFQVRAGGLTHPKGRYRLWTGFFYGKSGSWTNMAVTQGAHVDNRVSVGEIEVY